ncbi:MAG: glycosyltransferase family protein [Planctomycetota bacterium]|jgi:spore maturation protein CgeB
MAWIQFRASVDLLIVMECGDEEPWYEELAEWKCPKVYWEFDTALHLRRSRAFVWKLRPDVVCLANSKYLDAGWETDRVEHLPYAADPDLFPYYDGPREGAAIFGSPFPERQQFADAVGVSLVSGLYREEYVRALQRVKVSVHHHASGGNGLLVMRIFETLATGTLLLTEDDDALAEVGLDYEVQYYDSVEDCKELVDMYMGKEETRDAHARFAHEHVMAHHTYRHRAERILEVMR